MYCFANNHSCCFFEKNAFLDHEYFGNYTLARSWSFSQKKNCKKSKKKICKTFHIAFFEPQGRMVFDSKYLLTYQRLKLYCDEHRIGMFLFLAVIKLRIQGLKNQVI